MYRIRNDSGVKHDQIGLRQNAFNNKLRYNALLDKLL